MDAVIRKQLKIKACKARMGIIEGVHAAKSGHPGGSLSSTEILTYLYFKQMNIDPKNPKMENRIFSGWYTDEKSGTDLQVAPVGADLTNAEIINNLIVNICCKNLNLIEWQVSGKCHNQRIWFITCRTSCTPNL